MAPAYCPACGRAQVADARFCSNCGQSFEAAPTAPAAAVDHQAMAQNMLYWQRLEWKLRAGRLLGLAAGILAWWFVVGPAMAGNPIGTFGAFFVLAFLGIWIGGQLVLQAIAKPRQ